MMRGEAANVRAEPGRSGRYPFSGAQLPSLVGGEFVDCPDSFENISPVDGRVLCRVGAADPTLVDRAVQAARAALRGPWARLTLAERCALLRRVAERIEARF